MPNVRNSTNKLNTRSVSSAQQEANRRRQEELRRRREAERRRAEARRKQEEARRRQEEARKRLAENSRQREQAANRNRKADSSMRGGVSGKTASKANRVSAPSYTERLSKEEKMRRAGMQLYQWTQQAKEQKFGKNGLPKSFMPEQNAAAKSQNGMFDLLIPKKQEPGKAEIKKNGNLSTNRTSNKELSDTDYQSILKRSDLDLLAKQGKEQEISDTKNGTRGMWRSLTNELDLERQEREKGNDDPSLQVSSQMTDDELKTYYAVYALHGMEEADKYKERINQSIQERVAGNRLDEYNDLDNEAIKAIAGTIIDYGSGVESGVQGIQQTASLLGGNEKPHDSTSGQITREKLREGYTGARAVVSDLTNNVGNMTPALMASLFPGGQALSAATLGVSSFGNSYRQAKQEGKPTDQAVAYAIPSALSEVLMQKVLGGVKALGGNTNLAKSAANAMGKAVKNPIAQKGLESLAHMGSEGAEEYLQALLDPILRNAAFGEQNKLDPLSEDKLYAAFLGALSAEAMNLPADVANVAQTKNVGKTLNNSEGLQGLIESGLESSPDSASFGQAQRLQNREAMGKKASDFEVGSLANANQAAIDAEAKAKAIMENAGIRRAFNPNDTVTLANGNEGIVIAREGNQYVVAETGKQGYSSVNIDDITGKVRSSAQSLNKYIAPEVRAKLNEKYDARHVERTANQVFLDKLTQGRGIKAVVEDMQPGAEAFYDRTTNTIHFAPDSTRAEVIGGVTAHELAHAEEGSPNYAKYSDYVMEKLFAGDSAALAQAIEAKQERYILHGIDLSDADAAAEIVADYTRQLYKSEADIDALVTGNRSMAQSIYDSIKTAIRKIRAFFKGDSATLANIREYQELQRAQKLFERALSTRENVQAEAAPAYALNEFGLEEYTNNEIQQRANSKSILFANSEQDIVDFVNDYIVNRSEEYKRLYIGKVGEALADRIFEDTGIDVGNYNVILRSDFENRHANVDAEQSRGQIAITPELIGRLPEIISAYDSVAVSRNAKNGKPALVFEKDVDGKKVAVEYISDKRKEMALQTMYGWENKKNHPTAESAEASPITSETRSGTGSFDNIIPQSGDDVNRKYSINEGNRTRKAAESLMKNPRLGEDTGNALREAIEQGEFQYIPISNKRATETASRWIDGKGGVSQALSSWLALAEEGQINSKTQIAQGEQLLAELSDMGDTDAFMELAAAGTRTGQMTQAFSMLNRLTPQGRMVYVQRQLANINREYAQRYEKQGQRNPDKAWKNIELSGETADAIMNAKGIGELNAAEERAAVEIARQLPASIGDKVRAWRYLSMLGNLRTHARNIVGNAFMRLLANGRNTIATGLERVFVPKGERTKALLTPADRANVQFAKAQFEESKRALLSGGKYGMDDVIDQNRKIFNAKWLEFLRTANNKGLEASDAFFMKGAYSSAFAQMMKARGYTKEFLTSGTKEANTALQQVQQYAQRQGLEMTFREFSKTAAMLNNAARQHKGIAAVMDAVLPFRKTPINILKQGLRYSPAGLVERLTRGVKQLANGDISASEFVEGVSSGLAGTGLTALGYILGASGIILAGSGDDREGRLEQDQGYQGYSIRIGDNTYSLDWLAPVSIPLFIGVEMANMGQDEEGNPMTRFFTAIMNSANPVMDMSILQSIDDFMSAYSNKGGAAALGEMGLSAAASYAGQYVPTILGQIARTIDPTRRTTYAGKDGPLPKELESFLRRMGNKIPGLSYLNEPYVDIFGREQVNDAGPLQRFLENGVAPWYRQGIKGDPLAQEALRVYDSVGETAALPHAPESSFSYGGKQYSMTASEFTQYKKTYGEFLKTHGDAMIESKAYARLSDAEKADALAALSADANKVAKQEMLSGRWVGYDQADNVAGTSMGQDAGGLYAYKAGISDDDKKADKLTALLDTGFSEDALVAAYASMFEDKDAKGRNTISYAREQGVRPTAFVEREIQRSAERGQPGDIEEDAIWENGKVVVNENGTTESGTKKAQACENLLNSGYTGKEKAFFYQKEYSTDNNFTYYMAAGLPVDDYLRVKGFTAPLKADKDENGKSISGSKKEKLTEFLESSGMSEEQKLFFFAQNYKISGKEAQTVRDYIGGLNASDEVKEKLLESVQLGGSSGGSGRRRSGGGRSSGSAAAKKAEKAAFELSQVKTLPDLDWSLLTPKKTAKATPNTKIPDILAPLMIGDKIREETLQKELAGIDESPLYTSEMKQKIKAGIRARYKRS
ncbi:hypothetical protein [Christensenella hongkongensis]|uniref:PBECR3 domain-containing polyvalent protein n=1 Tax=Christensenella hongkongensis TaxID=270498 RepID=UPI0026710862|nr:hypothetical protein [Christensenella hongkongensis]